MSRSVVSGSLGFPQLVIAVSIILVFFGASRLNDMPVDVYPEFAPVTVEVRSEALGLSAEEVADLITAPLEADLLSNVPWVELIRSESVAGLSSVELIFEPGTDLLRARQVVQERVSLAGVALPGASKPPEILQPRSSTSRVMMVGISSEQLSLIDLSVLARWSIRPRLLGVDGVSNVAIWGQREKQLQVQVDPGKLKTANVSLSDVIETTANSLWASPLSFVEASVPGTGGWIDTPNQRIGIQHISPITTADRLALIPLEDKPELRLADVAAVVEDHQPLIGDAVLSSGPGLIIVIEKWPEANTLAVTQAIDEALEAMAPGLSGVDLDPTVYRAAAYIEDARGNLAILAAAVAIIVLLLLLLFGWRSALTAAVTIPLTIFAAANVLDLMGETLNLMVVAGLSAGLVFAIDDAVITSYALSKSGPAGRNSGSLADNIADALTSAHSPLTYATLIFIAILVPLFALTGLAGEFFPPAALAYGSAVVVSLLIAALVAPPLALLFLSIGRPPAGPTRSLSILSSQYERLLLFLLPRWHLAAAAAGIAVLVALGLATQLEEESLLPAAQDRHLLVEWNGPPGTSLPEMTRIVAQATDEIGQIEGVSNVGGHVGRAITSDQVVAVNSGEIWITIADDADYEATLARLQTLVSAYPGFDQTLLTYPEKRVREVLTGTTRDLVVRVYGEDGALLESQAEAVRAELASIDGVVAPVVASVPIEPTIMIEVDLQAAQVYGVKPGDVRRSATTLLSGLLVGNLFEEQKVFEVVVWSTPETRSSVDNVKNLLIDTPTGEYINLSQVANVAVASNSGTVQREAISRYVDVTADVSGRDLGAVETEVLERVSRLDFELSYHAEIATEKATGFLESSSSPLPYVVAAALASFLLLQAAFHSWRLTVLAFVSIPLALTGSVIAIIADGGDLSIGSYLGLLAVLGLSLRNGMVLINDLQTADSDSFAKGSAPAASLSPDLVLKVAGERLIPVVVTSLAVALAMLPVLVTGDRAGQEVLRPMAAVIFGGTITSALLHLLLMPGLYLRFWQRAEMEVIE